MHFYKWHETGVCDQLHASPSVAAGQEVSWTQEQFMLVKTYIPNSPTKNKIPDIQSAVNHFADCISTVLHRLIHNPITILIHKNISFITSYSAV